MEISIKSIVMFCFILVIASCSTNTNLDKFKKYITYILKKKNQIKKRTSFTRKILQQISYPLILVETNGFLIETVMLPITTRDKYRNFIQVKVKQLIYKEV